MVLVTSYTVAALRLRSAGVPLAALAGVYCSFPLYTVLLVPRIYIYYRATRVIYIASLPKLLA